MAQNYVVKQKQELVNTYKNYLQPYIDLARETTTGTLHKLGKMATWQKEFYDIPAPSLIHKLDNVALEQIKEYLWLCFYEPILNPKIIKYIKTAPKPASKSARLFIS